MGNNDNDTEITGEEIIIHGDIVGEDLEITAAHELPALEIIELAEAPALLKALLLEETDSISTIKRAIFGAYEYNDIDQKATRLGTHFYPETATITIDMGDALIDTYLYDKGMLFIPGVWFSLIHRIGHEICHALQYEAAPELLAYETLPQEFEDEATEYGNDLMAQWAQAHYRVPELSEMGWMGKQLVMMLNAAYTKAPDLTDDLDYIRAGASIHLDAAMAKETDMELRTRTESDVDRGTIGIKIDGKRFLTANEFFGMI